MISNVKILKTEILSDNWYILKKITYEYSKKDGSVQTQTREAYDRGNGATILLYNRAQGNSYKAIPAANLYKREWRWDAN